MTQLKIIIAIAISILNIHGNCQVISSCNIATELYDAYSWDISKLALSRIYEIHSPYQHSISIPDDFKDPIWAGLAAIYNAHTLPERDSIFDIYCIHNEDCFCCPSQLVVKVEIDPSYEWTMHWQNSEIQTGYEELDEFLFQFNFEVGGGFSGNEVALTTPDYINLIPFMDSLRKFNGIENVEEESLECCHNKIYYNQLSNKKIFTFYLGFGDGMMDCYSYYSWTFEVDNDCKVELTNVIHNKNSFDDPSWKIKNCYITSDIPEDKIETDCPLFMGPNPTNDFISFKAESNYNYTLWIYDSMGKNILTKAFVGHINISLNNYEPGIYYVRAHCSFTNMISYFKIIKI